MITGAIVGTLICGLFPLLFVPMFRRLEEERVAGSSTRAVLEKLDILESEVRTLESHISEVREAAKQGVC